MTQLNLTQFVVLLIKTIDEKESQDFPYPTAPTASDIHGIGVA